MTEESNPRLVKIGELLIAVGALTTGDLTEAIQISKRMGVPIGRVMVMSGCITEPNLQKALEIQSMIKDGLVDLDIGTKALEKVFKEKMELADALASLNWTPNKDAQGNKLGDLLIDSSIVSKGQLDRALEASFQSGMPLGGTLVLQGVLSPQLLPTVLHTQEQIRDGKMTRDEAIEELQRALMFWAKAGQSKQEELQAAASAASAAAHPGSQTMPSNTGPSARIAQPAAPITTPPVAQPAAAKPPAPPAPPPGKPQPQSGAQAATSVPQHWSSASTAANAPTEAVPAFTANSNGTDKLVDTVETEVRAPQTPAPNVISLVELLKLSGFCTQNTVDQAIQLALEDNRLASKVLLAIGFLDAETLNTYVRCQALIARGILRTEQVLFVLSSMRHRNITFEQATQELGVNVSV